MLARLSRHLTYTNVIATVAVFLALGGVSWAAMKLPRNSVGTKQVKAKAVTLSKIHPDGRALFTGPKGDKGLQGLRGPVGPTPPTEALRFIAPANSAEEPRFHNGGGGDCIWSNYDTGGHSAAAFFKDPSGGVHIKGLVRASNGPDGDMSCAFGSTSAGEDVDIFFLPEGYRPAKRLVFRTISNHLLSRVDVLPGGDVSLEPSPSNPNASAAFQWISLEGITFRAEQ
jgi:hypothetical protein